MKITRTSILKILGCLCLSGALSSASVSAATEQISPAPVRIGVIGAGWLGGTVAKLWVAAGHEVMFSSRHPEELKSTVAELGSKASVGTPLQAAEFGSVLLFAVPYDALPALGKDLGNAIKGKVVLDATNPTADSDNALTQEAKRNGVGATSLKYLPGTRLVRAFNSVDAGRIAASANRTADKLGVGIASDDEQALATAAQLVRDAGSEPVITGDLKSSQGFEDGGPGFRANTDAAHLRKLLGLNAN
ncbi:NADPH-dependent F420 reductase [Kluyvera sp. STS39-E]|uniref:NADPH-dependent F420 reductase n=1 Tax=Enterobacteriaceae TaxID=543 RepID=UPI000E3BBB26|nr:MULTISPECIES: NADPH-dependent F420 reductase [Citrobacter]MBD0826590.1 NADPH-dependent F420 reductase [Citrobacter sp. C1]RFU93314.1 NADP oxidoreductase [Citrobacter gillenii]